MNPHDATYFETLQDVLDNGIEVMDRTGVGTKKVFGRMSRYDLTKGFPLLTTKKLHWDGIVSELLWFIEGSGDERRLAEIRYGKPREELIGKTTIWTANAEADCWKPKAKFEGDLGNVYGVMWRTWPAPIVTKDSAGVFNDRADMTYLDQLRTLIEGIKKDPQGRRHILQTWNPAELPNQCLPPCHMSVQFNVTTPGMLSAMVNIRSQDLLLGQPFNIASYALLLMMVAQICDMTAHEVVIMTGDTHIYLNHFEQVAEQMSRNSFAPPQVILDPSIKDIDGFTMGSIKLIGYESQPAIKAPMAV